MKTRIISGAVMVILLIPCLFFSHTIIFDILLSVLALVATYEMLGCVGMRRNIFISLPAYLISVFVPLTVRVLELGIGFSELVLLVFIIFLFYVLSVAVFSKGKISSVDVTVVFTMIFYIIFGFSAIISVRNAPNGAYLFLLIFMSSWISDTGAYFTGVFFGKKKLIPEVSPKKTIEGAIGGLFFCVLSFVIYGIIMQYRFDFEPNYIMLGVLGLILSVISICGDLIASLIKRHFDIKDYGNLIPGHGGIMDRFDSVIATASVMGVIINLPIVINNIL